jgi:hypothetical protein
MMGKLSSHAHECPRCGMRWERGGQIIRTSARILSRHIARSAGLKDGQELRLYGKSKNERKLEDGNLSA